MHEWVGKGGAPCSSAVSRAGRNLRPGGSGIRRDPGFLSPVGRTHFTFQLLVCPCWIEEGKGVGDGWVGVGVFCRVGSRE